MSNEFVSSLSASVNAGAMILNDYLLEISDIKGGHRLTVTRGSEVQTMDVLDGEGGGAAVEQVQADWKQDSATQPDYILNRPFHGAPVGDTLRWDGAAEDHDIVELPMTSNGETTMLPCYRIGDNPPSADEIKNGDVSVTLSDGTVVTSADTLLDISMVMEDGFAMLASLYILVVPYNNYALVDGDTAVIFPRRGVYMTVLDGVFASALRIAGFEFGAVQQLDARYIPGYECTCTSSVEWDGAIGDRDVALLMAGAPQFFVRVSDAAPDFAAMLQGGELGIGFYSVDAGLQEETIPAKSVSEYVFQASETVYAVGEYFAVVALQDGASFTLGTLTVELPRRGMYFMYVMDESTGAAAGYVTKVSSPAIQHVSGAVLQEECIPASIQRVGDAVILQSSTEGSSKRFCLQVDDAGALTAIELTE